MSHPPPPGWSPPVAKPGVVALRPLTVGDFFDGAFMTIRRNPGAMVGLAAAVTTLFLLVPAVVTLVVAASGGMSAGLPSIFNPSDVASSRDATAQTLSFGLLSNLGALFGALAQILLNGILVRIVAEAVLGRRTTAGRAWAATRGRLLRLVALTGLNLLVGVVLLGVPVALGVLAGLRLGVVQGLLVGLPLLLVGLVGLVFVQVRYFLLAAPALVLERAGVVASLRRAGALSRGQFWRLLGVAALTALVAGLVGQVIAVPLGLLGAAGPALLHGTAGGLVLVFASYLSQVVVGAVTTPFSSAVVALQYVDQRIRKEGLDVQLMAAAQPQ